MKREDKLYRRYLEILREELTPAIGCTEPIAVAYAAAKARELLGKCRRVCWCRPAEVSSKMSRV